MTKAADLLATVRVARNRQRDVSVRRDYELAERVGTREVWDFFLSTYPDGFYAKLAQAQRNKLAAEEARVAATEKARLAAEERARLAAEGAKAGEQGQGGGAGKGCRAGARRRRKGQTASAGVKFQDGAKLQAPRAK
jgi:hypothetical protein